MSATFDAGYLAAGYAALAQSDCRVDIENPPLVRMSAALPMLASHVKGFMHNQEIGTGRPAYLLGAFSAFG